MWAYEATHVLDNSKYGSLSLLTEINLLSDITQTHFLGCGDYDSPCDLGLLQILDYGDVLI